MRRPLILTGGPAVGKTTCARALATTLPRCAVIDVDDLRQLVLAGAVPPWVGEEGLRQHELGVTNACALATNFRAAGFEVVVADVLSPATALHYRRHLPEGLVVHLRISLEAARERAATRRVHLSEEEFDALHRRDLAHPPAADQVLEVAAMSMSQQVAAIDTVWTESGV